MKQLLLIKWLNTISIKKKLYFTVGIMALLIVMELLTLFFAVKTLSSVRAYVQGEGLYSKAQKDAVYHLFKYGLRHQEEDYMLFKSFMEVPHGDHKAKIELNKPHPDLDIVRSGFLEGRNHPDDINGMINLFRRFHDISYLRKAIGFWNEADSISNLLIPISLKMHAEITAANPSTEKLDDLLRQVHPLNQQLTRLEDNFSYTLGDGSRWLENIILTILFIIALTVELSGLLLTILIGNGISSGIGEIIRASKSVAKGNFKDKAKIFKSDEIGDLAKSFNQMTTDLEINIRAREESERKQREFDLFRHTESKFRLALEAAPIALVMMDDKGNIVLVNKKIEKLFGYSREELMGQPANKLIPQRLHDSFLSYRSPANEHKLYAGEEEGIELSGIDKFGREFPVEMSVNPLKTDDGMMALTSIIDITKRKKDEEQLLEAKENAEQMSLARQEFLSVMSHEMRTPLNAVVGITHLLMEDKLTTEQEENINILHFSTQSLLSLINNILDFSKIESGKLQLETIGFNLNTLVKRLMDSFRHSAQEKQVKLLLHNEIDLPESIKGDPVRITQVLTNLIHNAIKFTEKGEICLTVKSLSTDTDYITILFEISDTGIGIEQDKLIEIFDSYTQAKPSITRQFGGTGLGLTICKKLVKMMGGDIQVKSEVNKGSVFSFQLEFELQKNEEQKSVNHRHEKDFNLKGINVLLVEDNVINQVLAKKFITRWGATVDTAANGQVAVKKVNENKYDIVLMDLQMPLMDGYSANRIIRDMGFSSEKLPVIALSAYLLDEVKTKVRSAGMNDYLSKPIDPHELYRKIVKNIKRKRRNKDDSFLNMESDHEILSVPRLLESFDDSFRMELLRLLETEFNDFHSRIASNAREGNIEEVRQQIHKIMPSLKRFEYESLSPHLEELKNLLQESSKETDIENVLAQIHQECKNILFELKILKEKYLVV